ncbi:hypothetical protein EXS74_01390 [Candidatus Woesearchaeota archaeon]|nr:hypothetical protein [Candidatus Woesearchaeota archaeon]
MPTNNDRSKRLFGRDYIPGDEWISETTYVPTLEESVRMVREADASEQRIRNYNQLENFRRETGSYYDDED